MNCHAEKSFPLANSKNIVASMLWSCVFIFAAMENTPHKIITWVKYSIEPWVYSISLNCSKNVDFNRNRVGENTQESILITVIFVSQRSEAMFDLKFYLYLCFDFLFHVQFKIFFWWNLLLFCLIFFQSQIDYSIVVNIDCYTAIQLFCLAFSLVNG